MRTHFNNKKWNERFLLLADHISLWSKDPSTKVGAAITDKNRIVSLGFNGFPSGVNDSNDLYNDREEKYPRVIHAEMNAILMATRPLDNCILYCTHVPCSQCAGAIIQKNIKQVIIKPMETSFLSRWEDSIKITCDMFLSAGVDLFVVAEDPYYVTIFHAETGLVSFEEYRRMK